jgi:hypothetical protein
MAVITLKITTMPMAEDDDPHERASLLTRDLLAHEEITSVEPIEATETDE